MGSLRQSQEPTGVRVRTTTKTRKFFKNVIPLHQRPETAVEIPRDSSSEAIYGIKSQRHKRLKSHKQASLANTEAPSKSVSNMSRGTNRRFGMQIPELLCQQITKKSNNASNQTGESFLVPVEPGFVNSNEQALFTMPIGRSGSFKFNESTQRLVQEEPSDLDKFKTTVRVVDRDDPDFTPITFNNKFGGNKFGGTGLKRKIRETVSSDDFSRSIASRDTAKPRAILQQQNILRILEDQKQAKMRSHLFK